MTLNESQDFSPSQTNRYMFTAEITGPIRLPSTLNRNTHRALKSHNDGQDFFTNITLVTRPQGFPRDSGGMGVEFGVEASSPAKAHTAGCVYLSQLCDLTSALTRVPIQFLTTEPNVRNRHGAPRERTARADRILTNEEWSWITGNLVYLRREHPRYLAAASWYRKGLNGQDCLDDFCCFWRVIERLADSYAERGDLDWSSVKIKEKIAVFTSTCFSEGSVPPALHADSVSLMYKLRNDLSHGNTSITPRLIVDVDSYLESLAEAAFLSLKAVRQKWLNDCSET